MKRSIFRHIAVALVTLTVMVACNPLAKMEKNAKTVTYKAAPDPLEMHGDSVSVVISGKVPAKYLAKKAAIKVTPIFEVEGKVVKTLDPFVLVGEVSDIEGTIIKFATGGSFTFDFKYPYTDDMERGTLKVKLEGMFKTKTKELGVFDIAEGTNITPKLVMLDDNVILGKDAFTRVVPFKEQAEILYKIQSSVVTRSELNAEAVKEMLANIEINAKDSSIMFKGLAVEAYASPDGELTINENLADNRAKTAAQAVKKQLSRYNVEGAETESFYVMKGKGEDWAGFKAKMEASSIEDKELIIRVLEMYAAPEKRESEIKNLAQTYIEVKEQILPPLRRSQMVLSMEKVGRTDAEIIDQFGSDATQLGIEELLYGATIVSDLNQKLAMYVAADAQNPTDWRASNNMGYILLLQNKLDEAEKSFLKSSGIKPNAITKNNLGVVAHLRGNKDEAKALFTEALTAGKKVSYNIGIINIQQGNYTDAVTNMGQFKTLNAALAQILNGAPEMALTTIDASDAANSSEAYYLKAIAGARINNNEVMMENLKLAVAKAPALKKKAMNDVEFIDADLSTL